MKKSGAESGSSYDYHRTSQIPDTEVQALGKCLSAFGDISKEKVDGFRAQGPICFAGSLPLWSGFQGRLDC